MDNIEEKPMVQKLGSNSTSTNELCDLGQVTSPLCATVSSLGTRGSFPAHPPPRIVINNKGAYDGQRKTLWKSHWSSTAYHHLVLHLWLLIPTLRAGLKGVGKPPFICSPRILFRVTELFLLGLHIPLHTQGSM